MNSNHYWWLVTRYDSLLMWQYLRRDTWWRMNFPANTDGCWRIWWGVFKNNFVYGVKLRKNRQFLSLRCACSFCSVFCFGGFECYDLWLSSGCKELLVPSFWDTSLLISNGGFNLFTKTCTQMVLVKKFTNVSIFVSNVSTRKWYAIWLQLFWRCVLKRSLG